MAQVTTDKKHINEIEDVISRALKKIDASHEKQLIRFLPMPGGGYMHHFTLKKMKGKQPSELKAMIEKFVIDTDKPRAVAPKQRAPRGSRKKLGKLDFTRDQLERMLELAKKAGDKEMISILTPKRPLALCKRELISSIRKNSVERSLWDAYVNAVNGLAPQAQG